LTPNTFQTEINSSINNTMKLSVVLTAIFVASAQVDAFTMPSMGYARRTSLQMSATKEIKVGVVGCGRIGLVHLEAITKAPNVRPVIVSNPTIAKAEKGKCLSCR
jgi:threonine dehydrogenase-like Zn-dependent dehydrogenase